jgi:hypothetical protein
VAGFNSSGTVYISSRYFDLQQKWRSRGSSVSIVSDYELDDGATGVRSPVDVKDFSSSPCVQTSFEAYPAGTGDPFPGIKARPERDADHSPDLVQR